MKSIVLNATNISDSSSNSKFVYTPANPIAIQQGDRIALAGLQMYYSNFNITSRYGNNTISYKWIDDTVVSLTIPDGFYTIADLNTYIQRQQIINKHYVETSTGSYLYFLTMEINSTYYAVQLNAYAVPTSASAGSSGYTLPSGATWSFPTSAKTPQWIVSSGMESLLGISAGTYPSSTQSTDYYTLSTVAPQVSPVQSYILHCNILQNEIAVPPSILYSFSSDTTFGSLINIRPYEFAFLNLRAGNYANIEFRITDQSFNTVYNKDPNIVMFFLIKGKDEA